MNITVAQVYVLFANHAYLATGMAVAGNGDHRHMSDNTIIAFRAVPVLRGGVFLVRLPAKFAQFAFDAEDG